MKRPFIAIICLLAAYINARADKLTDVLAEEKSFYQNYSGEDYQRRTKATETQSYYDLFGEPVIDGFFIYDLTQSRTVINNADGIKDSTLLNQNYIMQSKEFYNKFSNLAITKDAIGDNKFAFIIGSSIETKFTPLTLNKLSFSGIRWDGDLRDWGMKATGIVSRIRPTFLAKKDVGGTSSTDFLGNSTDWSNYGDYDMIYGLHLEQNLGNFLDYGLTYLNVHHSDIKRGEQWYGNIPAEVAPDEIHFEVYDLTPGTLDDPKAVITKFKMMVNGADFDDGISPERVFFASGQDTVLNDISRYEPSYEAWGRNPYIFVFRPSEQTSVKKENIKDLRFEFTVSGNYLVFVSTDRFTASGHSNQTVIGTYDDNVPQTASRTRGKGVTLPTFYGDYISRAPTILPEDMKTMTPDEKDPDRRNHYPNRHTYSYTYQLNTASETFGVNFRLKWGDGKFALKGECQVNTKYYQLPGANQREMERRMAGFLEFLGDPTSQWNVAARGYYLAPGWTTDLDKPDLSTFFSRDIGGLMVTDGPLFNSWSNLDDNDDNDQYAENEPRQYPAGGEGAGDYTMSGAYIKDVNYITLPTNLRRVYDDPDGIFADRVDKNKNNQPDHSEDFLLFERDPPVFELGNDLNNNGVADAEDDDILPDLLFTTQGEFPEYNPAPVNVYTSSGMKSLGLKGVNVRARWLPMKTASAELSTEVGALFEKAVAEDFSSEITVERKGLLDFLQYQAPSGRAQRYWGLYNSTRYKRVERAKGLQLNVENEVRWVEDDIRNDAVTRVSGYQVKTDILDFRRSLLDNIILRAEYSPGQFLCANAMRFGVRHNFALPDKYPIQRTINSWSTVRFEEDFIRYQTRNIFDFNWSGRLRYNIVWTETYDEGWKATLLNPLKRLSVSPQFKITYDLSYDKSAAIDPRGPTFNADTSTQDGLNFADFRARNTNQVMVVPILRANYQLGEKTTLEFGRQWKTVSDFVLPEQNYRQITTLLQVRSSDTYKGNNIALIFGINMTDFDYDLEGDLGYVQAIGVGAPYDGNNFEIFARIYSGL